MMLAKEKHPQANSYLDCYHCKKMMSRKVRVRWNCGLVPPNERVGPGFPVPASWGEDTEICPGYLTALPTVIEAARARVHWEKGLLKERYEEEALTGVLFDCIEILNGAVGELESRVANGGS